MLTLPFLIPCFAVVHLLTEDFEAARAKALKVGAKKFFLEVGNILLRIVLYSNDGC